MNLIVNEFLTKTNNDPHKAYDEFIKYHLLAGKPFPEDVKGLQDFVKESNPQQNKPKKYISKKPKEYITMSAEEIVNLIKGKINLQNDCMKWYQEKHDEYMYNNARSAREALRILLCNITHIEYEYKQNII